MIRRFISVALSLGLPPAAVSRYPALRCSDFPHIKDARLPDRPAYNIVKYKLKSVNNFIKAVEKKSEILYYIFGTSGSTPVSLKRRKEDY